MNCKKVIIIFKDSMKEPWVLNLEEDLVNITFASNIQCWIIDVIYQTRTVKNEKKVIIPKEEIELIYYENKTEELFQESL